MVNGIWLTFMNISRVQWALAAPRIKIRLWPTFRMNGQFFRISNGITYQTMLYSSSVMSSKRWVTLFPKWQKQYNQNITVDANRITWIKSKKSPDANAYSQYENGKRILQLKSRTSKHSWLTFYHIDLQKNNTKWNHREKKINENDTIVDIWETVGKTRWKRWRRIHI